MPRGDNPKSRANLKPVQKGEVRNPTGINRKRPLTDRYFAKIEEPLNQTELGKKFLKLLGLPDSATWGDAAVLQLLKRMMGTKQDANAAIKEAREAIEGKAPERLEISGPERKEITIAIRYENRKK